MEEKMETKEFRESNKDLKEHLAVLENAVFELEEKLEEEGLTKTVEGFKRAEQSKADGIIDDVFEEEEIKASGAGRKHMSRFASQSTFSSL